VTFLNGLLLHQCIKCEKNAAFLCKICTSRIDDNYYPEQCLAIDRVELFGKFGQLDDVCEVSKRFLCVQVNAVKYRLSSCRVRVRKASLGTRYGQRARPPWPSHRVDPVTNRSNRNVVGRPNFHAVKDSCMPLSWFDVDAPRCVREFYEFVVTWDY
jgi:hypothetical protein